MCPYENETCRKTSAKMIGMGTNLQTLGENKRYLWCWTRCIVIRFYPDDLIIIVFSGGLIYLFIFLQGIPSEH